MEYDRSVAYVRSCIIVLDTIMLDDTKWHLNYVVIWGSVGDP